LTSRADQLLGEWRVAWAYTRRNALMVRRNLFFFSELIFWPAVGILSLGLLTRFLELTESTTAFILIGTITLSVVQVCQLDVAYAMIFDVWSKSVKHQFLAPVAARHFTLGAWIVGIGRGLIVFAFMGGLSAWAFGFDVLGAGPAAVGAYLLGCFMNALLIGIGVSTLVLLFGAQAETLAWTSVSLLVMVAGVYYPIAVLPPWAQTLAALVPLTYFLDFYRSHYGFPLSFSSPLVFGFGLSLVYLVAAHWILSHAIVRARRTGLLLKLSD
jgi:ABC-2 type transport system permease protein